MILIENNYSSKYWLTEDIKDCGKSNEIRFTINTEKLKVKHNNKYQPNRYENKNSRTTNTHFNVSRDNNPNDYQKKLSQYQNMIGNRFIMDSHTRSSAKDIKLFVVFL
jgi:hypothetical protein